MSNKQLIKTIIEIGLLTIEAIILGMVILSL